MKTITAPAGPWDAPIPLPGRYAPTRTNGRRVPGWEDVNFTALARDVNVSFRYLLAVMTGQRNCTLALLQHTAQALGITLIELLTRMETAYNLRLKAAEKKLDKGEMRRLRSERRALSTR